MTIGPNSRYTQGTLVQMPDSKGVYQLAVLRTVPASTTAYTLYVWMTGDRPDLVALKLLGDSSLWWAIFDINPELIDPLNVIPGAVIRIPVGPVMGTATLIQ